MASTLQQVYNLSTAAQGQAGEVTHQIAGQQVSCEMHRAPRYRVTYKLNGKRIAYVKLLKALGVPV